ncbi:30S ribosomal protein S12 methylthiotransferase RimO [Synechococcus sp. Cruz-9H2]|uniref:30S ribosomal protein S12 methylthiotransferase RimO n=1 Tax=unclassified Synechococcus TaxID=2626047 RepID=UPI0020CD649C|nr:MULTISPECIES: 30S ribosomal protein S12 methylthiotransferase RimO [unclassified Synechococcus]MCP9820798.1 30S ribosomal protein S12 methylthiotransferase RimO [Synechococcus sp. Cruz-9H2]MCP9845056.1 30S ribosomal protein S12 methylthiotransferase RimO [Synechococcus sp. Edmonson 11F2]MCP9857154.1 30S ribosomal protein S12 methylthiotransferase RimO [Synechococcus sp. Cruz-9C9]MCP9864462.1 30S ribosomal protein S12 methylthiotransferase RimO [Synechococcus sp. Cruz-7E5]MCP9871708.1 30S ri
MSPASAAFPAGSTRPGESGSSRPTVAFAHLGCEKNRVDTEHMLGLLAQAGYGISADERDAAVVVVNTCSFIQDARQESVRTLVELAEQGKELIIAGCLAQHFREELLESLPEARAIVGTGDYQHIVEVLERVEAGERVNRVSEVPTFVGDEHLPRYRTTSEAVAYLKVAEGCDYRCAFCIIPRLRGDQRSRTIESVVAEAHQLAAQGVQELILISQITTNYGLDLYGKPQLAELLRVLGEVEIPWIRVHYAYPTGLTSEVLSAYRDVPNVLPYLDLPLQHSHPEVLRAMNRPWQTGVTTELLGRIRQQLPDAVLRTTFIVGFPGETEEHFEHLLRFVEEQRFDHVGVFTFSPEDGTAAVDLPDPVPAEVAIERRNRLMAAQQPIAAERNASWVGRIVDVLIEQENPSSGEMIGRCARFAPDVDGEVRVSPGAGGLCASPGTMVPVRITASTPYDLQGEVVGARAMVEEALATSGSRG